MATEWTPGDPLPHVHDGVPEMLAARGLPPEAVRALLHFDIANFQWTRMVAKGELPTALLRRTGHALEMSHLQGLTAIVRIRHGVGRPATEPTVGLVAGEMAVDPSRASRIVSALVGKGLVRREVAQEDARRAVLSLTDAGAAVLEDLRRERWTLILRVFEDWDAAEIETFACAVGTYASALHEATEEMWRGGDGGQGLADATGDDGTQGERTLSNPAPRD